MLIVPDLLDGIEGGRVVLPDFQRDFDWDEDDVKALVVTVLSDWPAGSLLLMDGKASYLRVRAIEGGPPPDSSPDFVILDGQQRLTALFQAFTGLGPHVFYVKVDALRDEGVDALEEAVAFTSRRAWDSFMPAPADQLRMRFLPLSALRSATDFFEWRDSLAAAAEESERPEILRRLTDAYRQHLASVHTYQFPAVILPTETDPSAVARIFERVNKTGMRLGPFDLVVARSFDPNWNLRDRWEEARSSHPVLDEFFGEDGMPLLQAIALNHDGDVRTSAVLGLSGATVRDHWDETVEAMAAALKWLRAECGVVEATNLPYRLMAVVTASAIPRLGAHRLEVLKTWFWQTSFALGYDAASNTRAVADFNSLTRGEAPDIRPVSRDVLSTATRRREAAIWRAFQCALAANGARDLLTGERLLEGPGERDTVLTPLFARQVAAGAASPHYRVLNLVAATRASARSIRRNGLIESVARAAGPGEDPMPSQFLPSIDELTRAVANPDELLATRSRILGEFLEGKGVRVRATSETID